MNVPYITQFQLGKEDLVGFIKEEKMVMRIIS